MTDYGATIQLYDKMTPVLNTIMNAMNMSVGYFYDMQSAMSGDIETSGLDSYRQAVAEASDELNAFNEKMQNSDPSNKGAWTGSNFQVFTNTGADRFLSETQSAYSLLSQIQQKQSEIAAKAQGSSVFPDNAKADINGIGERIEAIKIKLEQINQNPANPLDPNSSSELEKLRQQMSYIADTQNEMNAAVNNLDVSRANALYLQLNSKINQTEQYLRDNINAQGQFNTKIEQGVSSAGNLNSTISKIASAVGLYKIADTFSQVSQQAVNYASDLKEVQNVVDVTFNTSADTVNEWADTTLEAYGLNELSAKQYAGTMGAMLKSSGVTSDAVNEMSMTVAELSGDMASFYNLQNNEAFSKIRSGLSGETEPLKELGINMSVANLEAYALSQGISKAYSEMSQAEQTMLRYNYLLAVTSDAQGDFARTQDSYANQTKLLSENWNSFIGSIASTSLPRLSMLAQSLNNMFKSKEFQIFANGMSNAINRVITVAGWLLNVIIKIGSSVVNNWGMISPIIYGIAAAMAVYTGALLIHNGIQAIHNIQTVIEAAKKYRAAKASLAHAAATGAEASATDAATVAQTGFNTALLASPVTWIILAIIAVIAVILIVIGIIKKVTNTSTSALGMIIGAVFWFAALLLNTVIGLLNGIIQLLWLIFIEPFIGIIEWILNVCMGGFDSFGGAVANLIGQIISWFLSLGKVVTQIIDAIFGTDWTDGLTNLQNEVLSWGKSENSITISRDAPEINYRADLTDAYSLGAEKGDALSEKFNNLFSFETGTENIGNYLGGIEDYTAGTYDDTSEINDTIQASSDEELEYLRKIAEREAVNKYTTAEIKLDFTSNANIKSDMDIDGMINSFTDELQRTLVTTASGLER